MTIVISDPASTLTPRQRELLAMFASGHELRQIAELKFLSYSSVKQTLAVAKERVGAKSLAHLALVALEANVIQANGEGGYEPVQEERVVGE
jgi:DNA-binding NarL/FixJ family response regulator